MLLEPVFATTAMPVAGLIATSLGAVPTVSGEPGSGVSGLLLTLG